MDNKRIAELAIETRTHIVEALNGLDEIIKLAEAAGRDDIVATAKQARQPVAKAAKTFNGQVAENNGDATKIDPVVLDEANAASTKAKKTTEELLKELEKRVAKNESDIEKIGSDLETLKQRVDGHDSRFTENEAHLKERDKMLGVTKNPEGVWMVVPGGNLHIVQQTANHLGYNRDNDGNVTFVGLNERIVWWPAVVALVIALVAFIVVMGTGFGPVWASIWALPAVIAATIAFILTNRTPAAPAQ